MRMIIISIAALGIWSAGLGAANGQKEAPQPCVVLKRMGPADQITSHMYSFGIRGKQFQYVEGDTPKGVKFHGRLTDHDVRKIQEAGGRVVVLEPRYTDKDFEEAHKSCGNSSSGAPGPEESAKYEPKSPSPGPVPPAQAATVGQGPATQPTAPASVASENLATVATKSNPDGADITVDGKYMGSTPSTVRLTPGDHTILIQKSSFKDWQRTMTVSPGGSITIDASLEKTP
jgi:PEGA domain-containing protein